MKRRSKGPDAATVELVLERDRRRCVCCGEPLTGERGTDWSIHHRRGRDGKPDSHMPQNLIAVCGADNSSGCRGRIHKSVGHGHLWLVPPRVGRPQSAGGSVMATSFSPLEIRRRLGRSNWSPPTPHGPDGWYLLNINGESSVIVSCAEHDDGAEWVHASIAHRDRMPSYEDLKALHSAVFGIGWAYQVFAPPSDHVNIHHYALHLFGRLDGKPALPDFTHGMGSI